ncbi:MAG: hypothetical protein R3D45_09430 [Rhizobiaceae bacterium]
MSEEAPGGISPQEVRDALAKVVSSRPLVAAPQATAMLKHVVEQTLSGKGGELKAYSIGVDALGRPTDFDPQSDPSVRVLARSLRQALTQYYANDGRDDAVRIDIPTGRYEPRFSKIESRGVAGMPARLLSRPKALLASIVAIAAGLAIAVAVGLKLAGPQSHLPEVKHFEGPRVLVQPFAHVKNSPSQQTAQDLAIGLSAELVADMARYPWLSVVQLPDEDIGLGSLTEKASNSNPPHYVLSGRVSDSAGVMIVAVTLQSFPALKIKWSNTFRKRLDSTDIEKLQFEISDKIASVVGSENGILPELMKTNPPPALSIDTAAFRCFMEIYTYWKEPTDGLRGHLRDCLKQSVARNPGYAEAWAALAYIYMDEADQKRDPAASGDAWRDAELAIARALDLSPLNPIVLRTAMIWAIEKPDPDYAAFERYGRRNLELRPNSPHLLAEFGARLAVSTGKWNEGLELVARAFDLNPTPPEWYYIAPAFHALLENDTDGLVATAPSLGLLQSFPGNFLRAIAAAWSSDAASLKDALRGLAQLGISDAASADRFIEDRRYEPDLKARMKEQVDLLFG